MTRRNVNNKLILNNRKKNSITQFQSLVLIPFNILRKKKAKIDR